MGNDVRVRFAPSPTGHLHIGGARTALFNWLFARHHEGVFILRIEDTDRSRSTDEYIEAIVEGMRWLGLDWDEGPYRQTDRFDVYRSFVDRLLEVGAAYRCYCTPEDLEQRRQAALSLGANPRYDGRCREITGTRNAPFAVRFAMPAEGQTVVKDLIRGTVVFDNEQLDDMVILRSDGTPTYNFVVVVDDIDMRISHVIRGDDHLNNTPKQIHIYKALGGRAPEFAHLPMILGADKTRLSKRHGATSVNAYREMGYLPDALVNYLARLGWSHGDQEVFSREELVRYFSLEHVGKSAAVFNPDKLLWLNGQYMSRCSPGDLAVKVLPFLVERKLVDSGRLPDMEWLAKAVNSLKERAKTLVELAESLRFYVAEDVEIDTKAAEKFLRPESLAHISALVPRLEATKDFTAAAVEKVFHKLAEERGIKLGALAQPVRVALTGGTASPGLFEVIEIIGRDRVLKRLRKAVGEV